MAYTPKPKLIYSERSANSQMVGLYNRAMKGIKAQEPYLFAYNAVALAAFAMSEKEAGFTLKEMATQMIERLGKAANDLENAAEWNENELEFMEYAKSMLREAWSMKPTERGVK